MPCREYLQTALEAVRKSGEVSTEHSLRHAPRWDMYCWSGYLEEALCRGVLDMAEPMNVDAATLSGHPKLCTAACPREARCLLMAAQVFGEAVASSSL